jgi:hypothetical protein
MALPPAKFAIGDLVSHSQSPTLVFRVVEILEAVDDSPGAPYLYNCEQLNISTLDNELKYDDRFLSKIGQLQWAERVRRPQRRSKRVTAATPQS